MRPKRALVGKNFGTGLTLLGLLVVGSAGAQGLGSLTGSVLDATTHAPVAQVVVRATSPQAQGEGLTLTDASGVYRISQLPPGVYSVEFEKAGYQRLSRQNIGLDADRTLVLNVELSPGTTAGEEGYWDGPGIDVSTAQSGLMLRSTFSENVPISPASAANGGIRSYQGLALAAPRVQNDLFGLSIAGTSSPENAYLIDGLSFSDTGYGVNNRGGFAAGAGITAGSDFSVEFIDQLNVITGGYMPEYGRTTGGVLSLTTKSGGNEFHGSVFATWTPGFMAQSAALVSNAQVSSILQSSANLYNAEDVGFTLGGYIIKDKLWFFIGFDPSQYKTRLERVVAPYNSDGSPGPVLASATQNYFQTQTDYSYIGKLTYLINSDHRISLSIAGQPDSYTLPFGNGVVGDYTASSFAGNDNTIDMVLRLNSSFDEKRILLDITLGWHHQNNNVTAIDGSSFGQGNANVPNVLFAGTFNLNLFDDPALTDPALASLCAGPSGSTRCAVSGYDMGGGGGGDILRAVTEDRIQAKAVLTYFLTALGHQTLKAGLDVEYATYENKIGYPGGDLYESFSAPNVPGTMFDARAIGYLQGPDNPVFLQLQDQKPTALLPGAFLQDSWNVFDKVTVNLGVRFDGEYMYDQNGNLALALNSEWSPRIGVIWDPTYQGKSKIYASYAWYYEAVPLDLADRSLIGNENIYATHFGCVNPAVTGVRCSNNPATLLPGGTGPNQYWSSIGADKLLVDPNIGPQKTDEVQLGAEYEIFPSARLGVNYTHRGLSRLIEDYSNNQAASFVLGNPGQGIAGYFPQPARIYNAYTVAFTKAFANHWQAQASYSYVTLNGNVDGLFTTNQGQLDPNITALYDLPQLLINGFGPLAADIQHWVKLYGSYQFLFSSTVGLTIGAAYNGHSGTAISALGGNLLYGGDTVYIIPRGSYGWLPWVHQLDLHATIDIGLGQDMKLSVGADCFNVLGSQQMTAVDQSWVYPANTPVQPIPNGNVASLQHLGNCPANVLCSSIYNVNFGHPTAYQTPRNFRLLARFSF